MTEAFYLAAIQDAWEILGVKLRPFSLGHVILLHRIESPFLVGWKAESQPTFDDLAVAVLICSCTYEEALEIIEGPALPSILRTWADRITGMNRWSVRIGWNKATPVDFPKAVIEFCDYIKEHSKIPNYEFNPGDFKDLHCPEVQVVKVSLMRDMHIPEPDILDRCWGQCLWDYVTLSALDGRVKMVDEQARAEAFNLANELLAKINSGQLTIPKLGSGLL